MNYNVNTDLVNGNSVLLYISGSTEPIAYGKSLSLSLQAESVDTTSKMSGKFKSSLLGQISWTISSDFLYTRASGANSFDTLMTSATAGTGISVIVGTTTNSTTFAMTQGLYSGVAYITSIDLKCESNSVSTCSLTLTGSGELTKIS